ncbi:sel1 repeat family protein [Alginatibacterium sediminis]|uniref:Sel1 repeat family protein n=1 Tax=Alginatibacterium sediminis TaxID=2164068 RepID=A0A420E806_9ALTE|nr:tetratricopeptide repeat protein [Alginatibacterium sediminis]RKF14303.1 sel1 repeat family protein [Alginatibacterium sediminis]
MNIKPIRLSTTKRLLAASICALLFSNPSLADLEDGRRFMEQNQFEAAMDEFLPAAAAGNADAQELIGVMYAMGLGVEKDDIRAFDWYLRASIQGHPGAQSGIAWYYEVGRGIPSVDLIRAYTWYVLSAIGGDPDAAVSQREIVKKMTPEQIAQAKLLIADYKAQLYPFR